MFKNLLPSTSVSSDCDYWLNGVETLYWKKRLLKSKPVVALEITLKPINWYSWVSACNSVCISLASLPVSLCYLSAISLPVSLCYLFGKEQELSFCSRPRSLTWVSSLLLLITNHVAVLCVASFVFGWRDAFRWPVESTVLFRLYYSQYSL